MKYMGSKNRIAKYILPIILKNRKPDQWYVEPFVGGANTIDKVDGLRLASDCNPYVIQALKSIRDNIAELPKNNKEFTEQDYKLLRHSENYKHKGYAGFVFSYGGKWMGGWCRDKESKRDYVAEGYRNALKQSPLLQSVKLVNCPYHLLNISSDSIIYCDPPYKKTTGYNDKFDYSIFYNWCRIQKSNGHQIFISEYNMPDDFTCIWEKEINSSLTKNTGNKKGTEKLFTLH